MEIISSCEQFRKIHHQLQVLRQELRRVHSHKHLTRHRLAASCGFYQPVVSCKQVASSLLNSSCCSESETCCKLLKKLASSLLTSRTCYHQARARDANASRYWLDDSKATSQHQTCRNLRVSGCAADKGKLDLCVFRVVMPANTSRVNRLSRLFLSSALHSSGV